MPMPLRRLSAVPLALALVAACTADKTAATSATVVAPPPAAIPTAADPAPADEETAPVAAADKAPAPAVAPGSPDEAAAAQDDAAPQEPRRVLVLGDSLAATGFGALLEKRLDAHPDIECFRKAKSATGLARPDFYDWESEAKKAVKERKPDLVVVIMGGNDGQDLTTKSGKGKRVGWKSEGWNDAYKERVASFLRELSGDGRKVLWLGLPRTDTSSFEQKLAVIRELQSGAVGELGEQGVYLDTSPFLTTSSGELLEKASVGKRKDQVLREEDGIHFTMAGSEYFAEKVYPEVLKVLGVADVEPEAKKPRK